MVCSLSVRVGVGVGVGIIVHTAQTTCVEQTKGKRNYCRQVTSRMDPDYWARQEPVREEKVFALVIFNIMKLICYKESS